MAEWRKTERVTTGGHCIGLARSIRLTVDMTPAYQLEPLSPEDRAYRQANRRRNKREAMARARAEARTAGLAVLTLSIQRDDIEKLDALKELRGFRNRSQAFAFVMATFASDPKITKKLGL